MEEDEKLYCPYCGSSNLTANTKGFGVGKALTGAMLTGGIGLLAGFVGSNKVKITCLKCGHSCSAGDLHDKKQRDENLKEKERRANTIEWRTAYSICKVGIMLLVVFTSTTITFV